MRHDQTGRNLTRPGIGSTVVAALALLGCATLPTPVWAAAPQERVRSLVAAVLEDPALRDAGRKAEPLRGPHGASRKGTSDRVTGRRRT